MHALIAVWLTLGGTDATAPDASRFPAKVVVIGIDAVSLNVLQPYIEQGVTPNLGTLVAQGTSGHLESFWPQRTPQVWTSIATGKPPGVHGIWDHLSNTWYSPPGVRSEKRRVVTSKERRSRALWGLLDEKSIRSLVVGWVMTWPAEPLRNGVMVAPVELFNDRRQTTIKGSFYRDAQQMVTPASLWPKVKKLIVEPADVTDAEIAAQVELPPPDSPVRKVRLIERYLYTFRWSLARARSVEEITTGLLPDARPDVVMTYFQCPDTFGHRFWIFQESVAEIRERLQRHGFDPSLAAPLKRHLGGALESCYRDLDQRVGRMLAQIGGPDTLVLVISDHGFGHIEKPHPFKGEPFGGVHLDEGILIAAGPGVAPGQKITGASAMDITPTILFYLGLPVAGDMTGKPLKQLFTQPPLKDRAVETIPTYEAKPQLENPYPRGYPKRKGRLRPVEEQMGGKWPGN